MTIKALNHVGLSVADLDRSLIFYRDLLGMRVLANLAFEGEPYDVIMRLHGVRGRVALLERDEMRFELFEFEKPVPQRSDPERPVCDHGITHFCLEVTDIAHEYSRLRDAGVIFHAPPPASFRPNKAIYGRDPDGNVFELVEKGPVQPDWSELGGDPS